MSNRPEAGSAKAALTNATGRLPLLRLFSTPLIEGLACVDCLRQSGALVYRAAPWGRTVHKFIFRL